MPSSPRRVRFQSGQKGGHTHPIGIRADEGHRPLQKTTCVFSVGGDALIAPWGTTPERLEKRTRLSRWHPGRCGHRPLQKTTCVFSVGGDARIAPWGMSPERAKKTDTPIPSASGPMRASAPTKNNVHFQRRGRCPHRPAGCVSGTVRKDGHAHTFSIRADVGCIVRYDCLQIVRGDRLQFK